VTTYMLDKDAVLDFAFDWTPWLAASETISTFTLTGTGLTVNSSSQAGPVITAWVSSGGVAGRATLACRITTNQGRTDERTIWIGVTNR
jgi:hypothetical protein